MKEYPLSMKGFFDKLQGVNYLNLWEMGTEFLNSYFAIVKFLSQFQKFKFPVLNWDVMLN